MTLNNASDYMGLSGLRTRV